MPSHFAMIRLWPFLAALMLPSGGCTTMTDLAGVQRTGYQPNGTYVLSPDEESLACRQIQQRLDILSNRITNLPNAAAREQEGNPTTMLGVFGRMFGGEGGGLKATADFQRASAESDALKALAARKKCPA
jgi:hypothetical protein